MGGGVRRNRCLCDLVFDSGDIRVGYILFRSIWGIHEVVVGRLEVTFALLGEGGLCVLIVAAGAKVVARELLYVMALRIGIGQCLRLDQHVAELLYILIVGQQIHGLQGLVA